MISTNTGVMGWMLRHHVASEPRPDPVAPRTVEARVCKLLGFVQPATVYDLGEILDLPARPTVRNAIKRLEEKGIAERDRTESIWCGTHPISKTWWRLTAANADRLPPRPPPKLVEALGQSPAPPDPDPAPTEADYLAHRVCAAPAGFVYAAEAIDLLLAGAAAPSDPPRGVISIEAVRAERRLMAILLGAIRAGHLPLFEPGAPPTPALGAMPAHPLIWLEDLVALARTRLHLDLR